MKTTYVIILEHKNKLPPDFIDAMASRIYTLQCLDQGAKTVDVKTMQEWIREACE